MDRRAEKKIRKHSNRHKHDWLWIGDAYSLLCKTCKKLSFPGKPKTKQDLTKGCFGNGRKMYQGV